MGKGTSIILLFLSYIITKLLVYINNPFGIIFGVPLTLFEKSIPIIVIIVTSVITSIIFITKYDLTDIKRFLFIKWIVIILITATDLGPHIVDEIENKRYLNKTAKSRLLSSMTYSRLDFVTP